MVHRNIPTPIHVLVVDDDEAVRESLGLCLESLGYEVDYASDGQSALERIERCPPEVIVTDLQMPGMDGLALLGELPSRGCAAPVIAISGGCSSMLDRSRELGAAATFAKPVMDDVSPPPSSAVAWHG